MGSFPLAGLPRKGSASEPVNRIIINIKLLDLDHDLGVYDLQKGFYRCETKIFGVRLGLVSGFMNTHTKTLFSATLKPDTSKIAG